MPVVSVVRDKLFDRLGRHYTDEEFEELCFEFGIELDDVTTEKQMERLQTGAEEEATAAAAALGEDGEEIIYRIDIPANRYDLLCLEGIARALNVFKSRSEPPVFKLHQPAAVHQMHVKPETALIRPFVVAAILRDVTFDKQNYNSFIELQDKLHQNLCRKRSLVAIGTHDLSKLTPPFTYEALPPREIRFVPLKKTEEFTAEELMTVYQSDNKLKKFLPIIEGSPIFPVIYDSNRTVASFPPIINSAHSAISLDTKDIFIECTATDLTKAKIVLNTLVAMFSEYCRVPFTVEPVEVIYPDGYKMTLPEIGYKALRTTPEYINKGIGVEISPEEICSLLSRMQLPTTYDAQSDELEVNIPPVRSDVLHACDVMEDVAIAYGYNNIQKVLPTTATQGGEQPLNQLSDHLRQNIAMAGFTEVLTWALISKAENFDMLLKEDTGSEAVKIGNPKTVEFEVARTSLLPGILKTCSANKDQPRPLKIFELSDVVLIDSSNEVGARNERRVTALYSDKTSGFEVIHSLIDRIMQVLGVPWIEDSEPDERKQQGYVLKECGSKVFLEKRQSEIIVKGQKEGSFGVVHPKVLAAFGITYPVSALEMSIEWAL